MNFAADTVTDQTRDLSTGVSVRSALAALAAVADYDGTGDLANDTAILSNAITDLIYDLAVLVASLEDDDDIADNLSVRLEQVASRAVYDARRFADRAQAQRLVR